MPERPYNPLDRINLARSVEATLLQKPLHELPLDAPFRGVGLYAIYYAGKFRPYKPISSRDGRVPIYVGKAEPKGARKGLVDANAAPGNMLFNRIRQHAKSIEAANNLEVTDFLVRYLLVEDIFIGLSESLLLQQFRPLWNVHIAGFGLHEPGSGRHGSERSEWDEMHPGRPWYDKMTQKVTQEELIKRVRGAFRTGAAATSDRMAAQSPRTEVVDGALPVAPDASD